ncbi:putative na/ca exchanger [Schistosoma mansoni]|uniref:putative na/ca exchanger n=1 Tax=Schistosoma mansoni TaxID=6183 RepID=UPI00022DC22E|nr:putative na/ca exchanger [Schistosoma mansoni]|eukprot:XP_018651694.1 putative na/ca exchanger [Schistosoma mansoni]
MDFLKVPSFGWTGSSDQAQLDLLISEKELQHNSLTSTMNENNFIPTTSICKENHINISSINSNVNHSISKSMNQFNQQIINNHQIKCYPCPKCNYTAKWPTELQKHVMVHANSRPFICCVCTTSYKWSWDLGRHFTNSHPNLPNPYKLYSLLTNLYSINLIIIFCTFLLPTNEIGFRGPVDSNIFAEIEGDAPNSSICRRMFSNFTEPEIRCLIAKHFPGCQFDSGFFQYLVFQYCNFDERIAPTVFMGVTLLAFGNGAPDVFSAVTAITTGDPDAPDEGLGLGFLLGFLVFYLVYVLTTWVSSTYMHRQRRNGTHSILPLFLQNTLSKPLNMLSRKRQNLSQMCGRICPQFMFLTRIRKKINLYQFKKSKSSQNHVIIEDGMKNLYSNVVFEQVLPEKTVLSATAKVNGNVELRDREKVTIPNIHVSDKRINNRQINAPKIEITSPKDIDDLNSHLDHSSYLHGDENVSTVNNGSLRLSSDFKNYLNPPDGVKKRASSLVSTEPMSSDRRLSTEHSGLSRGRCRRAQSVFRRRPSSRMSSTGYELSYMVRWIIEKWAMKGVWHHFAYYMIPIDVESWPQQSVFSRFLQILQTPIFLVFRLTIPTVIEELADDTETQGFAQESNIEQKINEPSREISTIPEENKFTLNSSQPELNHSNDFVPENTDREPVAVNLELMHGWCKPLNVFQCLLVPALWPMLLTANGKCIGLSPIGKTPIPIFCPFLASGFIIALTVFFTSKWNQPPRHYHRPFFATLGFITSIIWIYALAHELVNSLETLGIVWEISEAILGLSVMALASSIGDIMSNCLLARNGYPRIAYAACLGSPLFNLLLGAGLSYTVKIGRADVGYAYLSFTLTQALLFSCLLAVLTLNILTALIGRFQFYRYYGIVLIIIYLVFVTTAILIEVDVIVSPVNWNLATGTE